jgi:hypothetical protein
MAFTLPIFNQLCDYWPAGVDPTANPPTFVAIPCQPYVQKALDYYYWSGYVLRMPKQAVPLILVNDTFKITTYPNFAAVFFQVLICRIMHMGFPNEYWAVSAWTTTWVGGAAVPTEILA